MAKDMRVLLVGVVLLSGCTSYERFIDTLNTRQVTSCVQADLAIGGVFPAGGGNGAVHLYTATGGANLQDCIRTLRYGQVPEAPMPALTAPGTVRNVPGGPPAAMVEGTAPSPPSPLRECE